MKKYVVTGGAGFIGSHLVDELIKEGYEVFVLDNLSSGRSENINKKATFHKVDIRNLEEIKKVFKEIDGEIKCVFHVAAMPRVGYSIENPNETNDVNVTGTLNVLIASRDFKAERFIYSASSSVYGDQDTLPQTEDMQVFPKSPYGLQKYIGELYCKQFSDIYDLPTVSLRYFNVYGPRLDPRGEYALVIGKFILQKKENKPLTITGDGKQTRDFTHVYDIAKANILAMKSKKISGGEVINIGGGKNISINELASIMGGPVNYIEKRLEPKDTLADISLAKNILNWEPSVLFLEGINELKKLYNID